ncbi:yellow-k [Drosophila busckii]|uniref:Yellow-k n=1 Tax=Drosophila busckii TaxID=30019 RepID=A0A0M5IZ36_DROBS|nr:yellow-k [Drosophila busckii]
MVVQLGPRPSSCELERHIFFIMESQPQIVAYDILEQTWHRRDLMSNKYENMSEAFHIRPIDFTFGTRGELIVADHDGVLYSSIEELQLNRKGEQHLPKARIQLKRLGSLLGPSRSMLVDNLGALFYVIPKFGAVVRCAQLKNLTAEGNEIIYLTSKNIQQIFTSDEGAIWVLSDRVLKPQDICYPGFL